MPATRALVNLTNEEARNEGQSEALCKLSCSKGATGTRIRGVYLSGERCRSSELRQVGKFRGPAVGKSDRPVSG